MSGWGSGPWGSSGWGSGDDPGMSLLTALAVRENVVRLTFSLPPFFTGILDPGDASDPKRYQVTTVDGVGIDGEPVRPVNAFTATRPDVAGSQGTLIDVTVDRPFSHWPCRYRVSVVGIRSSSGVLLDAGASLVFQGVQLGIVPPLVDRAITGRDIANPQVGSALVGTPDSQLSDPTVLGTFRPDGRGDYATDRGLVGYRKRVIRRLVTRKNAFAHLPGYGVGVGDQAKKLARPGAREALASDAEEQIRLEPETRSVRVQVLVVGGVTTYRVVAEASFGRVALDVPVP